MQTSTACSVRHCLHVPLGQTLMKRCDSKNTLTSSSAPNTQCAATWECRCGRALILVVSSNAPDDLRVTTETHTARVDDAAIQSEPTSPSLARQSMGSFRISRIELRVLTERNSHLATLNLQTVACRQSNSESCLILKVLSPLKGLPIM